MYKVVAIKMADILSVAVSIFAAVTAYTIGVEKWRSLQGFFLGLALWLVALAPMVGARVLERTTDGGRAVHIRLTYFLNSVALAFILPLGALLPFMGEFRWKDDVPLYAIDLYTWRNYGLIFAGVAVVIFAVWWLVQRRKK